MSAAKHTGLDGFPILNGFTQINSLILFLCLTLSFNISGVRQGPQGDTRPPDIPEGRSNEVRVPAGSLGLAAPAAPGGRGHVLLGAFCVMSFQAI